jgi:hypothetical protein
MSYNEAYEIISKYANSLLPFFADGWERWPVGERAKYLTIELAKHNAYWIHSDVNTGIDRVIEELTKHC